AQASGTPVIAGPGVPEEALVEGRTGFKIRSFDPKEYVEKLKCLLDDRTLWSYMSKEARKHAEKFDHTKIAARYLQLYHR
ncbi:MAG: glycosyltransferase, partial [Desulfurococcaceae archaeon]